MFHHHLLKELTETVIIDNASGFVTIKTLEDSYQISMEKVLIIRKLILEWATDKEIQKATGAEPALISLILYAFGASNVTYQWGGNKADYSPQTEDDLIRLYELGLLCKESKNYIK